MAPAGGDRRFRSEHRLRKTDEFSSVFAFRKSLASEHFQLHFRPNSMSSARLGLVIGRRQAPTAVLRNLIKRLARESFRHCRAGLPCMDLALRLRAPAGNADRKALRAEIDSLLARLPR